VATVDRAHAQQRVQLLIVRQASKLAEGR